MLMLTLSQFAKKHKRARSSVHYFLIQGRIAGAVKRANACSPKGFVWMIPADAKMPRGNNDR